MKTVSRLIVISSMLHFLNDRRFFVRFLVFSLIFYPLISSPVHPADLSRWFFVKEGEGLDRAIVRKLNPVSFGSVVVWFADCC